MVRAYKHSMIPPRSPLSLVFFSQYQSVVAIKPLDLKACLSMSKLKVISQVILLMLSQKVNQQVVRFRYTEVPWRKHLELGGTALFALSHNSQIKVSLGVRSFR